MPSYTRVSIEVMLLFVLGILRFSMAEEVVHWRYHGDLDSNNYQRTRESCDQGTVDSYTGSWRSEGPKYWPEHVPTCGGRSQSPVDIKSSKYDSSLGDFNFSGYDEAGTDMYKIWNNGHTIQVNITNNDTKITGGGLKSEYTAAEFHFHWGGNSSRGSEHALNGKLYPMELQVVHYKTSLGSIANAAISEQADALAVLGFFFEVTSSDNENLTPILSQLDNVSHADNSRFVSLNSTFNLQSILPQLDGHQTYHRYSGSLTMPKCSEVVIWTVFEKTIGISETQLTMLRNVFETEEEVKPEVPLIDNYRPVQALGNRSITTSTFHWSYEEDLNTGPSQWAHHYEACGGNKQSPIDIPREKDVQYAENLGFIKFCGYDEMRVHKLKNNGHSLQVDVVGNFYISGGGLGARYQVAQFHFHWASTSNRGSEHTFDGTAFPMELHIVHYKEEYGSLNEALGKSDGLAVLGFMFKLSPTANCTNQDLSSHNVPADLGLCGVLGVISRTNKTDPDIPAYYAMADKGLCCLQLDSTCKRVYMVISVDSDYYGILLRKSSDVKYYGESTNTSFMRLMDMLPLQQQNLQFFRYNGSLTTPPCTESVIWTIFTEAIYISEEQLKEFRELHHTEKPSIPVTYGNIDNNYRPVQRLNGRRVLKNFKLLADPRTLSAAPRTLSAGTLLSMVIGISFLITKNH